MRALVIFYFCMALSAMACAQERPKSWLGVKLGEVTKEEADKLGWEAPAGTKIVSVDPKGPASGKLKPGDVIVLLDGVEVEDKAKFETAVAAMPPGTEIKLRIRRGRKEPRISVTLGASPLEPAVAVLQEAPPPVGSEGGSSERPTSVPLSAAELALLNQANFRDCPECPEMVPVPAGSFTMGSPDSEPERSVNEGPQHGVTIAKPFAVGKFAVTFAEWDACVAGGGCGGYKPKDEGWGRGDRPVINVSWNDAKAYVAWLSRKTGKAYRLLSEAEREYVTRAGTETPYWWGSTITPEQASYAAGESRQKTVPVKSFKPNPWGLYQVHGNVYEWVEDCWNDGYNGAPSNGSAWTAGDCTYRVLRGGSWNLNPQLLRSAFRINNTPADRDKDEGFRVARGLDH
jgi:formylglycine-generating enzyme required for sulfatase activity